MAGMVFSRKATAILAGALAAGATALVLAPRAGGSPRNFNPDRVATLELNMWQAYYAKQRLRLFQLLVVTLREQYGFSWATATNTAFHLARAAARFGDATGQYERVVPDLVRAFETIRTKSDTDFLPSDAAHAELAWWIARRVPGEDDAHNVGRLIAEEYALLYGAPVERVMQAGLLRAQAGALRDSQARRPDWGEIERLLTRSYQELSAGVSQRS
jgi:hypothetical protein